MSKLVHAAAAAIVFLSATTAARALEYDQNATPNYIAGSGSINGSFTVDRQNGVELGLRAKVRYNALNLPENTFYSNGDGTYGPFAVGGPTAPASAVTRARWNYEWTINTNFDGSSGLVLSDLTYLLSIDGDPTCAVSSLSWDPVTPGAAPFGATCWDHSMGDNSTAGSAGVEVNCGAAGAATAYQANIDLYNVLQQSWNYRFYPPGPGGTFDQNANGTYDISLTAFDAAGNVVASTSIQVIVGTGGDMDSDGDGVCDSLDTCPRSDMSPTVMIAGCDSGVVNWVNPIGCTVADQMVGCDGALENHGDFVSCIAHLTNELKANGILSGREKGAIQSCAARADVP